MVCSFCLWHRWIFYHLYYGAISILNGALCNQSQQLEAIIVTKSSILYVTGVLDPSLKSIDELKKRQYHLSPVFGFHYSLFHDALADNHLGFQSCCID